MKQCYLFVCGLLISVACSAEPRHTAPDNTALREKLRELNQRVSERDYSAFTEAAELPGSSSVPFLWSYARTRGDDPQEQSKALEAIKHVHGFKNYLQERITEITEKQRDPRQEFEILGTIGNLEAAEVVAPYLFDFRMPAHSGDSSVDIYNFSAAWTLGAMRLADSPTSASPEKYGPEEHVAWQKWAITHQMVPKEWNARVGLPDWQYRLFAAKRQIDAEMRKNASQGNEQQLPDPNDAKETLI